MVKQKQVKYLIVGQGITGTFAAFSCIRQKIDFILVDDSPPNFSSKVAAGIINPLTGRFIVKTWRADELIPFAEKIYGEFEELLQEKLFHHLPIYRIFKSEDQRNSWLKKQHSDDIKEYYDRFTEPVNRYVNDPYGGIVTKHSFYVDTEKLLGKTRKYLQENNRFIRSGIDYKDIVLETDCINWNGITAEKIIFCEGYHILKNPWFNWLPLVPAKGEVLVIKSQFLPEDVILNKGIFILPIGNHHFKVGATFHRKFNDEDVSVEGLMELEEKLTEMLQVDFEIVDQQAGVRPAVRDYRPLIGSHPEHPQLSVINGMGTKGYLLAPFFSEQLVNHLEYGSIIDTEVDIRRFWK
jgi:glycine/D-amino acid oxidase-like deaminating enzyme